MRAYVVVEVDVKDPTTYETYKELAPPAIAKYGGKYLARGGRAECIEGEWQPRRVVILEFPTYDQARAWWDSEEYREPKAMRQRGQTALRDVAQQLSGRHGERETRRAGAAGELSGATRPWAFGDTEPWNVTRTITNAVLRHAGFETVERYFATLPAL